MRKEICFLIVLVIGISILSSNVLALEPNYVLSNSESWKDVYSSMLYATFKGSDKGFLVSTRYGSIVIEGLAKDTNLQVITSKRQPYVLGYEGLIKDKGISNVEELVMSSPNLELIERLSDINSFIIVGSEYGYNAAAVAPYAISTRSWVFLADRTNIDEIDAILRSRSAKNVIIYGFVDREVKQALLQYAPEIVSSGDRFEDNVEIVKKYIALKPETKQVILTNGEFIENQMFNGIEPILFTGKENVPEKIQAYLKGSQIEVGVLIGNELVGAATNIRRSTGISVIVKYARGARVPTGSISAVEGLDMFYLPAPFLNLSLHSIKYNRASSQLQVTYKSSSTTSIYFKGTLTPVTSIGAKNKFGDSDPVFISPNSYKTVIYSDVNLPSDTVKLELFTLFGETPGALERILEGTFGIDMVSVLDNCDLDILGASYNKGDKEIHIKLKNTGESVCYADAEINDLIIDGEKYILGSQGAIKIAKGKKGILTVKQEMNEEDLSENEYVYVTAYYGEKEDSLVKVAKGKFKLTIESISIAKIAVIALIIGVIGWLIFLFWKRRKRDYDDDI